MKSVIIAGGMACMMLLSLTSSSQTQETPKKIRIGVYDNRAITLAYFGSEYNPFDKKMEEYKEARAAGDSVRIKELEEWGPRFQCQLHFQGFCRAPVDDLLLLVKDKMGDMARSTGVDMIGWYPDYTVAEVEIVDITDELVALFNPTQEKLKEIKHIKEIEPIALCDISDKD